MCLIRFGVDEHVQHTRPQDDRRRRRDLERLTRMVKPIRIRQEGGSGSKTTVTLRQLADEQRKLTAPFWPMGEYGPTLSGCGISSTARCGGSGQARSGMRWQASSGLADRLRALAGREERRSLHHTAGRPDRRSHPPGQGGLVPGQRGLHDRPCSPGHAGMSVGGATWRPLRKLPTRPPPTQSG